MRHTQFLQIGGLITVIGGCMWIFALETRNLVLALVFCWVGIVTTYYVATQQACNWRARVGIGLTGLGILGWLTAWLGHSNDVVLSTHYRLNESGQVIDVITYTIGYVAQRYLAIAAYLVFGVGLLLLAGHVRLRQWHILLRLLGYLSLGLYVSLIWEVYLDAITPQFVYTTLRLLFGLGWLALGYLLWSRASYLPSKKYRQFS